MAAPVAVLVGIKHQSQDKHLGVGHLLKLL
jgi:hypothetical protein